MRELKENLVAGVAGLIFGVGLVVSGMTQPHKVIGFLDFFGNWDLSLIFVMGGAVTLHLVTYPLVRRRPTPILAPKWQVPTKTEITKALIIGSILFGAGWGIGGFCPGPAITSLASFNPSVILFVGSMLLGMLLFKWLDKKLKINR
jgi:uncharacterized membrane protein YedE/YeeE